MIGYKECPLDSSVICFDCSQCEVCDVAMKYLNTKDTVEDEALDAYSHEVVYKYDGKLLEGLLLDIVSNKEASQADMILDIMAIIAGLQEYINVVNGE